MRLTQLPLFYEHAVHGCQDAQVDHGDYEHRKKDRHQCTKQWNEGE